MKPRLVAILLYTALIAAMSTPPSVLWRPTVDFIAWLYTFNFRPSIAVFNKTYKEQLWYDCIDIIGETNQGTIEVVDSNNRNCAPSRFVLFASPKDLTLSRFVRRERHYGDKKYRQSGFHDRLYALSEFYCHQKIKDQEIKRIWIAKYRKKVSFSPYLEHEASHVHSEYHCLTQKFIGRSELLPTYNFSTKRIAFK